MPAPGLARKLAVALKLRARAWTNGDTVSIAESAWRRAWRWELLPLLAHEAEHALDSSFGNDEHHGLGHLCGRAVPPLSVRHLSPEAIRYAESWLGTLK